MNEFNTSLLREKFIIRDVALGDEGETVIALGNRMVVPLYNPRSKASEIFIVRAQNMHTTARLAARLEGIFSARGSVIHAKGTFNWDDIWHTVTEGYERQYNPECWAAIYYEGEIIFEAGERHPFLDIVEKFDIRQGDDYAQSVKKAEKAFQEMGKTVTIEHETNIALVVSISPQQARCGVILRAANGTTTFNFTARERSGKEIRVSQCLSVAAAYLEGLQLAYFVGVGKRKISYDLITDEIELQQISKAEERIGRLNHAILQFDVAQDAHYRPDRPDLFKYLFEAEKAADKILKPMIAEKIKSGEIDGSGWVE